MYRLWHAFIRLVRTMKLSSKMFWMIFLLVESIILLLGYSYYRHSSSVLEKAQQEYAVQMADKSNEYLELNLRSIRNLLTSIANDSRLRNMSENGENTGTIQTWLNENLFYFSPYVKNIHLIEDAQVPVSTSRAGWKLLEDPVMEQLLTRAGEDHVIYWSEAYASAISGYTVTGVMRTPTGYGTHRYLALDLDLEKLYQAMQPDAPPQMKGELLLLDNRRTPVFGGNPYTRYDVFQRKYILSYVPAELFEGEWSQTLWEAPGGNTYFVSRIQDNLLGWQVVWLMDRTLMLAPLLSTLRFTWLLAALSVVLSFALALSISKFVSQPIRLIAASMSKVSQGVFDVSIPVKRQDELGFLAKHFNQMTRQIASLIEDLKRTEEKKKAFEFKALQAQIKPHFIFNTLNAISISAKDGELRKVDTLITSLTKQLDYALKENVEPVTFRGELTALEHYVELMKIRYQDRFIWECDADPATLSCALPKFTLQPLVENAIFHGLIASPGGSLLFVGSMLCGDEWEIQIEDDGAGIAPERLKELKAIMKADGAGDDADGIGLVNVHQRFRMMFGDRYSMNIDSRPGTGTHIRIRLPIETAESAAKARSVSL